MIKLSATALVAATALALSTGCALEAGEESDQAMATELEDEQLDIDGAEIQERAALDLPDHLVAQNDRFDLIDEPYPLGEATDDAAGKFPIEEPEESDSDHDDFCYEPCNSSDGRLCRRDVPECSASPNDIPDMVE